MARIVKPLSPMQVKNAKPKEKTYKLTDGGGLYLSIYPNGSKLWHMKVILPGGKENRLSFGKYPDVSLDQARQYRNDARILKAAGLNPVQIKKSQKTAAKEAAANSFEVVAREWFAKQQPTWAESHSSKTMQRLEKFVFPWIGSRPITEITAPEYLTVFRRVEDRGIIETAHRVRSLCGQIHRYAIATGRAQNDPISALQGALPPRRVKHLPAITEPKAAAELLRAIEGYKGSIVVSSALKIAPYVFVRPGELRAMQWADINFDAAEWRFTVSKTKTDLIVPLARQVVNILKELQPLTGHGRYVFPSERGGDRAMSDNAILSAFRRMGIPKEEMTGHGFRAMARTILDEVLGEKIDLIEHQLAHKVKDPLGRAYNRTSHLPERRRMMQRWADYLDDLKVGAKIIPLRTKKQ